MTWSLKPYNIVMYFSKRTKHVPEYLDQRIFANMLVHISLDLQSLSKFFLITFLESRGVKWFHNHFYFPNPHWHFSLLQTFSSLPWEIQSSTQLSNSYWQASGLEMMHKGEKNCNCIMTVLTIGQRPKVSPENNIDPGSGNVIQCTGHGIWS